MDIISFIAIVCEIWTKSWNYDSYRAHFVSHRATLISLDPLMICERVTREKEELRNRQHRHRRPSSCTWNDPLNYSISQSYNTANIDRDMFIYDRREIEAFFSRVSTSLVFDHFLVFSFTRRLHFTTPRSRENENCTHCWLCTARTILNFIYHCRRIKDGKQNLKTRANATT